MQISQLVSARRARWRIADVRTFDDCRLLSLVGVGPPHAGVERQLLTPFDIIEPIAGRQRPLHVRARRWRRACRAAIADARPPGGLRSLRDARIDLMPHQIEPALAVLRGLGCRVLLADEVGLGKTVQAGLVISELRARAWIDRVLVVTPAGLRQQWANELSTRFRLDAVVIDAVSLGRLRPTLPLGVNPWLTQPIAIASVDYVKRPEVLPAVLAAPWDVVVVDEAHGVAGDSDRQSAVGALAARAAYVLLLTATPHNGDRRSFSALCDLGSAAGDPLVVFRRARSDIRAGAVRRIHIVPVRTSAAEQRMHTLVDGYTTAIHRERGGVCLAASVLHKRALSSAWSLAQSIDRRLALLARPGDDAAGEQLALPLGDPDGELNVADEAPLWPAGVGLVDRARELRLLRELHTAARLASLHETKLAALIRILRRSHEPAIVFTEYRDTLTHVQALVDRPAAVLHGGLRRDERAAALDDFAAGRRTLLLATDAGSEGLNLHHSCRLVINLELPWNPMRLEQRIGRIDRIGQRRAVHAFHLVAAGTGETRILARLKARIARARSDVGAPDPVGAEEEHAVARLVMLGTSDEPDVLSIDDAASPALVTPDLRAAAVEEAQRAAAARALCWIRGAEAIGAEEARPLRRPREPIDAFDTSAALVARARSWRTRARLRGRVLLLWRVALDDASGRPTEAMLVPMWIDLARRPPRRSRGWIEALLAQVDAEARGVLDRSAAGWRDAVERTWSAFVAARLGRERAIGARLVPAAVSAFQPGLFDRRAERARLVDAMARASADTDRTARLHVLERAATLKPAAPQLLLVLTP